MVDVMTLEHKTRRAVIFHLDYSEKACNLGIFQQLSQGWFTRSNFRIRFLLEFKEVTDAEQHFMS